MEGREIESLITKLRGGWKELRSIFLVVRCVVHAEVHHAKHSFIPEQISELLT